MNPGEVFVKRRFFYRGKIVDLKVDRVRLADGREALREVVGHLPAVAIVPLVDDEHVILIRQYRHAVRRWLWEIPAGLRGLQEAPLAAARRELREETGYAARQWRLLGGFLSSPGFCEESIRIYLARQLGRQGALSLDEDEVVVPQVFARKELIKMIRQGKLEDAKTVLGLQLAAGYLGWRL